MLSMKEWKNRSEMKNDVVIIGAGPAGLAAAIECRKNDLQVVVLDEFPQPGGRLLGQLHEEPTGEWWNGIKETKKLVDKANQYDTEFVVVYLSTISNR